MPAWPPSGGAGLRAAAQRLPGAAAAQVRGAAAAPLSAAARQRLRPRSLRCRPAQGWGELAWVLSLVLAQASLHLVGLAQQG